MPNHLTPGGAALPSGQFDRQAARVIEAHHAIGLRLHRCIRLEIWTTPALNARRR